jgi:hypothetical protein
MMDNKISIRSEQREGGFEDIWIEGYAAVFNQRSKLILENNKLFYEVIKPEAFDDVLRSENLNVKAVIDHDNSKMLARTKSGTLELSVDDYGLKYRILLPDTSLGRDIQNMVERGDIYESSFKYSTRKGDDVFSRDENGDLIHTVNKIRGLYDVSLVVDGAFANTNLEIAKRSLQEFEAEEQEEVERKQAIKDELETKRNYLKEIKDEIK